MAEARPQGTLEYRIVKAVLRPPTARLWRVAVEGLDHLPVSGPVIVAANHRSFMDSIFLALAVPRPVSFLAKAEYFDSRLGRIWFTRTGQIPLRRGSPAGARRAMTAAADLLRAGGALGIYPEGTRSRDGQLQRGRQGPVRLARETGAPIVPVGLLGTELVQRPGQRLPRPFRAVTLRFGAPLVLDTGDDVRGATQHLMAAIGALCGQAPVEVRSRGRVAVGATSLTP